MKKFTPYVKGLITTGVLMAVLTILNFYFQLSTTLCAITFTVAYACLYAAAMAPDHEKYKNVPLNPSHHDRTKRQS